MCLCGVKVFPVRFLGLCCRKKIDLRNDLYEKQPVVSTKKNSKAVWFSFQAYSDSKPNHEQTSVPAHQMTESHLFASLRDEGKRERTSSVRLPKERNRLHCAQKRDIDCQSEMRLSPSPRLGVFMTVDISPCEGSWRLCLAALHLRIIAFMGPNMRVSRPLCSVGNYSRLISISKQFTVCPECVLTQRDQ